MDYVDTAAKSKVAELVRRKRTNCGLLFSNFHLFHFSTPAEASTELDPPVQCASGTGVARLRKRENYDGEITK